MKLEDFSFGKYHGLGNDYILIDDRKWNIPEKKKAVLARKLCEPHFSVGADGLIYVCKSEKADIRMRIFNDDGSEAEMCGNGIRCFSKYVYDNQLIVKNPLKIETLKGIIIANLSIENGTVDLVEINMGSPILDCELIPVLPDRNKFECINESILALDRIFNFTAVSMGNPHCVIIVENQLNNDDLNKYGAILESHERFPQKTNVEFLKILSKEECTMRVFERAVGITNSCGTGSCACVVAGTILGKFQKNQPVTVHNDGGDLKVTYTGEEVFMKGPIEKVFSGTIKTLEF
ncbi:MAG: Diaminopimelate epimerase [Promethearchaeota archaeon]|nr:MAG: Diaminopimelate epimerase [Candidatus Lokiarchaeota archaeon]